MKVGATTIKISYIGAGAGVALFALVGLLPGSLIGGAIGLSVAGGLFGFPVSSALLPRLIVGASMLVGVLASALIFIAGAASAGLAVDSLIAALKPGKALEARTTNNR